MNNDKPTNRSTTHELENALRTLVPRDPKLDMDAICKGARNDAPSLPPSAGNGATWLTFGGACAASALLGVAITLAIVQPKIQAMHNQIAALTERQNIVGSESDVMANDNSHQPKAETSAVTDADSKDTTRSFSGLPRLAKDGISGSLIVGSHLKRVALWLPSNRPSVKIDPVNDHDPDASDGASPRSRPTTRATLMADLLDT